MIKTLNILLLFLLSWSGLAQQPEQPVNNKFYWTNGGRFGDTLRVDGMGNSAVWDSSSTFSSIDLHERSELVKVMMKAQTIRSSAGIGSLVDIGLIDGTTVGSIGPLTQSSRVVITSENDAQTYATSGDGSHENPYIIRDRRIVNSAGSSDVGGFNWEDASGEYSIRLSNSTIGGYGTTQIFVNTQGKLLLDSALIFGTGTYTSQGNNARGIIVENGEVVVENSVFDKLGNQAIQSTSKGKLIIRNVEAKSDSGDATSQANYFLFHDASNADSVVLDHLFLHDSVFSGVAFFRTNMPLQITNCEFVEFPPSILQDIIYFAFQSNDLTAPFRKVIAYNYVRAEQHNSFVRCDRSVSNILIKNNDVRYAPSVNRPLVYLLGKRNAGIKVDQNRFDHITINGNGSSEPCYIYGATDCYIVRNYTVASSADGYELYNPRSHNYIINNVIDSCDGQAVDIYSDAISIGFDQRDILVDGIFGTCKDHGVLVTDSRGVEIRNAFIRPLSITTGGGLPYSVVHLEQRSQSPFEVPASCVFSGGSFPSALLPSGSIFSIEGNIDSSSNRALFIDSGNLYTYNLDDNGRGLLSLLQANQTEPSGIFETWRISPASISLTDLSSNDYQLDIDSYFYGSKVDSVYDVVQQGISLQDVTDQGATTDNEISAPSLTLTNSSGLNQVSLEDSGPGSTYLNVKQSGSSAFYGIQAAQFYSQLTGSNNYVVFGRASDPNTGLYYSNSDVLNIATGGTNTAQFSSSLIEFNSNLQAPYFELDAGGNSTQWDSAYNAIKDLSLTLQDVVSNGSTATSETAIKLQSTASVIIGDFDDVDTDLTTAYIEVNETGDRVNIEASDIVLQGTIDASADLLVNQDIVQANANTWHYFGDPDTDGSFRMGLDSGTGNLVIQARESGSWVTKDSWTTP